MNLGRSNNVWLLSFLLPLLVLSLVGCGGKPATVSGVITLEGQPVERGTVGFTPVGRGMKAVGLIQSDGSYSVKTNREDGLEVGEYQVTIVSREPGKLDPNGGPPMPGDYIVPKHYGSIKTSGLRFEVEKGSNTFDIDLSSKPLEADRKPKRRRR